MRGWLGPCVLVLAGLLLAHRAAAAPRLEDYPATVVRTDKPAAVRIEARQDRLFRTMSRIGAEQPANFAGHFVLTSWGAGPTASGPRRSTG